MLGALQQLRPLIVLPLLGALTGSLRAPAAPARGQEDRADHHEYAQVHMGVLVRIRLYAPSTRDAERAANAAFSRIARLDQMMSDYRPDSELRRLESSGKRWTAVSPELFDIMARAVAIARASDGAFDPTAGPIVALWREARETRRLPDRSALDAAKARTGWMHIELDSTRRAIRLVRPGMRLDLGGIAKGYILQQAIGTLRAMAIRSALIEAGGDIVVSDAPPGRRGWHIDAPGSSGAFRERAMALTGAALATSGSSEQSVEIDGIRYSHVVDPRTGVGVTHRATVRVVAADGATADALATALSVLGPRDARPLLARFPKVLASLTRGH
jgi:thiamine biosynthesis lipoprotein